VLFLPLLVGCLSISPTLALERTFAWDANPVGENVTGYKIYYGTGTRTYTQSMDVGNVTTYSIDLPNDTQWYVSATAYKPGEESPYSNEIIVLADLGISSATNVNVTWQELIVALDKFVDTTDTIWQDTADTTWDKPVSITLTIASGIQKNVSGVPTLKAEFTLNTLSGIQKNISGVPAISLEATLNAISGIQKNITNSFNLILEGGGESVTLTVYSGRQKNISGVPSLAGEMTLNALSGIQRNVTNSPRTILDCILTPINGIQRNVSDAFSLLPAQYRMIASDGIQKNISIGVTTQNDLWVIVASGIQKNISNVPPIYIEAWMRAIDGIQKNISGAIILTVSAAGDISARYLRVVPFTSARDIVPKFAARTVAMRNKSIDLIGG
jgi:hypothetical protein